MMQHVFNNALLAIQADMQYPQEKVHTKLAFTATSVKD